MQSQITPRLLTKSQAAHYCGLSASTFGGTCPVRPIALGHGVRMQRYDVWDINKWIDSLKEDKPARTTMASILLAKLDRPTDLDDRHVKVLRYMRDHPECDTAKDIRGAGDRTLALLAKRDFVHPLGSDERGLSRYGLSAQGRDVVAKMDEWERSSSRP